jgi:FixJ family two-component response regulator
MTSRWWDDLPPFFTQKQLAKLLDISERTLERHRHVGSGIPFTKLGKRVYYPRDKVIEHMTKRSFTSAAEARRIAREDAAA